MGTGGKIWLDSISKRGDSYVRTLLLHDASSVLAQAKEAERRSGNGNGLKRKKPDLSTHLLTN